MTQEALKLALEALEDRTSLMKWQIARDAVKEALAQPEQEPVWWMSEDGEKAISTTDMLNYPDYEYRYSIPLYTTPPQRTWVGLTEQEAAECWSTSTVRTWQSIEAKLKQKNGYAEEKNT